MENRNFVRGTITHGENKETFIFYADMLTVKKDTYFIALDKNGELILANADEDSDLVTPAQAALILKYAGLTEDDLPVIMQTLDYEKETLRAFFD